MRTLRISSMPFPLAHPAAVLPLRRHCRRWLNFPALVIGSLCPDVGYAFGSHRTAVFSHRFLAGGFGFCLPVGLLILALFYGVRRPVVQRLPEFPRRLLEPFCRRPAGPLWILILSVLAGAWSHILLDATTHENGWIVEHLPALQARVIAGTNRVQVSDVLYEVCTFAGSGYVAWTYLTWLDRAAGARRWIFRGFPWAATLLFATGSLLLSFANHCAPPSPGLVVIGFLTLILTIGFLAASFGALRPVPTPRREA